MQRPKLVLLETAKVVERFQDYVADAFDEGKALTETVVKGVCDLMEEWETSEIFVKELAKDLVVTLGVEDDKAHEMAIHQGVYEIALDLATRIERAGLVEQGVMYHNYHSMQGYNVILQSTI